MIKRLLLAATLMLSAAPAFATCPTPLTGKDGGGTTQNFGVTIDGSGNCYGNVSIVDGTNAANKVPVPANAAAASTSNPGLQVYNPQEHADLTAPLATQAPTNVIGGAGQIVSTNNANTLAHRCGSYGFKHITTNTDTQLVAASGSTTIYVCDYSFDFTGVGAAFLEKSTTGTCGSPTQIDQTWTGTASVSTGKARQVTDYSGLNTGASAQLCVNTSGLSSTSFDIGYSYDQY